MSLVLREQSDGICVLTLHRPERKNALSGALVEELRKALTELESDTALRAVVLTGSGDTFCSGGDLADGLSQGDGLVAGHERRGHFAALLEQIREHRVPVIAALNGDALGGGCGLAAACDLVVADSRARLGTPEIKLGLFPWIILAVLQRDVPRKPLLEAVLTGEKWTAQRAMELGLVNRVTEPGQALVEARALAARIASMSPVVVRLGKASFHRIADQTFPDALATMHAQLTLNLLTEDAMEGVGAFLHRREPVWKGR
jgi:enoyl-CoA hydratase/carnithine racemase